MQTFRILCIALIAVLLAAQPACAQADKKDDANELLFTVVHLTDTHVQFTKAKPKEPPMKARIRFGGYKFYWVDVPNSIERVEQTVEYINRVVKPDLLIHTGDISRADLNNALLAKKLLDQLDCPWYPLMGDNDPGVPLKQFRKAPDNCIYTRVFGARNRVVMHKGWRFILLSCYPAEADVAWLKAQLDADTETPTFLFTHRLLAADDFTTTLSHYYNDQLNVDHSEEIEPLIWSHPNVRGGFSGHCHCNLQWARQGRRFHSTAALVGIPISFRLLNVYRDRVETVLYEVDTMEDLRAGKWRIIADPPLAEAMGRGNGKAGPVDKP